MKPKHHYNFHCAECLDLQAQTLDCWTTERKHRVYKNCARNFAYNDSFEAAVLNKLIMVQEEQLKDRAADPCLLQAGRGCRYNYVEYNCGDLVFF